MDAKEFRAQAALTERSNDGSVKFAIQYDRSKCEAGAGAFKADVAGARPCAVIGPDRVVPPARDAAKKPAEPWLAPDSGYRRLPDYPDHKDPSRNISPRQTFQENMQRIIMPPGYNATKLHEDPTFASKNNKLNLEVKYCDVPYNNNQVSDQKHIPNADHSASNVNPLLMRGVPHGWPAGSVHVRPLRTYGAPEVLQYPEYANCMGPRPVLTRTHTAAHDEQLYADAYYHESNIRFKPYPNIKERYPPTRYEYLGNYPNPYHQPNPFAHKYELPKTIPPHSYSSYPQVPKYTERIPDPIMDGYQRTYSQQGNYGVPIRNPVIHSPYRPVPGNQMQSKLHPYPPDAQQKPVPNKLPYDPASKMYLDYDTRGKPMPIADNYYLNELPRSYHPKSTIVLPNFTPANMHGANGHPCYPLKNYDYTRYKNIDPSMMNHSLTKLPPQFSPSTLAISPADSNASNETAQTHGTSQEDCGYASQSSVTSARSIESLNRMPMDIYGRYDYRYSPMVRSSPLTKPGLSTKQGSKTKKDIRQFISSWSEGDDENAENSAKREGVKTISEEKNCFKKQYETVHNQEQLYVLGLVNVPSEELSKYEHIQKVSKLPENIKGYNSLELLNQFEEAIESSNISSVKPPTSRATQIPMKRMVYKHDPVPRALSPLDVEAKISQSVIHKDVGCNFEIKPCSPKMLNVEVATPMQTLLNERVIEKVSNPHNVNSPIILQSVDENVENTLIAKTIKCPIPNTTSSCKMINSQHLSESSGIDHSKTNYSLHDLESSSGVCLASLPRLDNDIELSFPEVNQQFINANKTDSVITTSFAKNLPALDVDRSATANTEYDMNYQFSPKMETETDFSRLSKYRKLKRCVPDDNDSALSKVQATRVDSVIIKNPDNTRIIEESTENINPEGHFRNDFQEYAMNLVSQTKHSKENHHHDVDKLFGTSTSPAVTSRYDDNNTHSPNSFTSNQSSNLLNKHLDVIEDTSRNNTVAQSEHFSVHSKDLSNRYLEKAAIDIPMNLSPQARYSTIGVDEEIRNSTSGDKTATFEGERQCAVEVACLNKNEEAEPEYSSALNLDKIEDTLIKSRAETGTDIPDNNCPDTREELINSVFKKRDDEGIRNDDHLIFHGDDHSFNVNDMRSNEERHADTLIKSRAETGMDIPDNNCLDTHEELISSVLKKRDDEGIRNDDHLIFHGDDHSLNDNDMRSNEERHAAFEINQMDIERKATAEVNRGNDIFDGKKGKRVSESTAVGSNAINYEVNDLHKQYDALKKHDRYVSKLKRKKHRRGATHRKRSIEKMSANIVHGSDQTEQNLTILFKTDEENPIQQSTHKEPQIISNKGGAENNVKSDTNLINKDIENVKNVTNACNLGEVTIQSTALQTTHTDKKHRNENNDSAQNISQNCPDVIKDNISLSGWPINDKCFELLSEREMNEKQLPVHCDSDAIEHREKNKLRMETNLIGDSQQVSIKSRNNGTLLRTMPVDETAPEKVSSLKATASVNFEVKKLDRPIFLDQLGTPIEQIDANLEKTDLNTQVLPNINDEQIKESKTDDILNFEQKVVDRIGASDQNEEINKESEPLVSINLKTKKLEHCENLKLEMETNLICDAQLVSRKIRNNDALARTLAVDQTEPEKDSSLKAIASDNFEVKELDTPIFSDRHRTGSKQNMQIRDHLKTIPSINEGFYQDVPMINTESNPSDTCSEYENKTDFSQGITHRRNCTKVCRSYLSKELFSPRFQNLLICNENIDFFSDASEPKLAGKRLALGRKIFATEETEINTAKSFTKMSNGDSIIDLDTSHSSEPNILDKAGTNVGYFKDKPGNETEATTADEEYSKERLDTEGDATTAETNTFSSDCDVNSDFGDNKREHSSSELQLKSSDETQMITAADSLKKMLGNSATKSYREEVFDECDKDLDNSNGEGESSLRLNENNVRSDVSSTKVIVIGETISVSPDHCHELSEIDTSTQNNHKYNKKIQTFLQNVTARPRFSLKRSLSDSALNSYEDDVDECSEKKGFMPPKKRKKHTDIDKLDESHLLNIIQSSRRNSISTLNNENFSFCILIDDHCIVAEENYEQDNFVQMEVNLLNPPLKDPTVEDEKLASPVYNLVDQNVKGQDTYMTKYDEEKGWVEDVGCEETIETEDIAENIVIGDPASPKDNDLSDYESDDEAMDNLNNEAVDHTSKVKHIYGDNMCTNDAQLVDALYRTPQMDVNKKLMDRESHITEKSNKYYDSDSLEMLLAEPVDNIRRPAAESNIDNFNFPTTQGSSTNSLNTENKDSTCIEVCSPVVSNLRTNVGVPNENNIDAMKSRANTIAYDKTQDKAIHSCESSLDNVFSYIHKGDGSQTTSSSPEVSSTTSEEKNSSILLKISNFKGSRISEVKSLTSDIQKENNCKLGPKEYFNPNYTGGMSSNRPLRTKAAQKYIPPLRESIPDLKVKLALPQQSLLKFQKNKITKEEPKLSTRNIYSSNNNTVKLKNEIPRKIKPKFEDVLKNIDEAQFQMHKEKNRKAKKYIPKVVIKKTENGSHYASTSAQESFNPDLTGRRWQPWVFIEKNKFIDAMALKNKSRAVYSHRRKSFVLAEHFCKYKSIGSAKFVISQPKINDYSTGKLKYTIKLKHSY